MIIVDEKEGLGVGIGMRGYGRKMGLAGVMLAGLAVSCGVASGADKTAPPAKPAGEYAAFDQHKEEHVTIAIEPCDEAKMCPFFRLPYVQHALLPVRVIITNDGEKALTLDEARMQFISGNNDKLPAATDEEINRRLFSMRDAQGTKIPLIPITIHKTPVDKNVTKDQNDFGFSKTVVAAHSTLAGYLFYDVKELDDPAMKHAELYVKMVKTLDGKQELFGFTVPFDAWLKANPGTPSNETRR